MRRGDPDAGRGVHGLQQVARQFAQRAVEHGHGLRREGQPGVGIAEDGADGHVVCSSLARLSDGSGNIRGRPAAALTRQFSTSAKPGISAPGVPRQNNVVLIGWRVRDFHAR